VVGYRVGRKITTESINRCSLLDESESHDPVCPAISISCSCLAVFADYPRQILACAYELTTMEMY